MRTLNPSATTEFLRPGYAALARKKIRFDLQLFAEPEQPAEAPEQPDAEPEAPAEPEPEKKPEEEKEDPPKGDKKYTDAEVDKIVARKLAQAKKEQEKAVNEAREEAEKLAKMNREQKEQYKREKLQQSLDEKDAEIARLKQEAMRTELEKAATATLRDDHEITATQDILDFVVGTNAKETNANIRKLIGIIQNDRKEQEERRARGRVPKAYRTDGEVKMDSYTAIAEKFNRRKE